MEKTKTVAVNTVIIAIICIALIWGNTYWRQRTQFYKGEAARIRGDYIAAVAGYESAIHLYTPGSSLVERAAVALWSLGESSERAGDSKRALIAYRSLRSSFYAVHGLFRPGREWITRCDARIGALAAGAHPLMDRGQQ
jgi:hypothetical protein